MQLILSLLCEDMFQTYVLGCGLCRGGGDADLGRILDWYKAQNPGFEYTAENDPGEARKACFFSGG